MKKINAKHPPTSLDEWRSLLRRACRGKDNSDLFALARQLAPDLEKIEVKNGLVNLKDWYAVASKMRHAVTHADYEIKTDQWKDLNERQQMLCEIWFPFKMNGERRVLSLDKARMDNAVRMFLQYAFQIFKFLSQANGLDWNIFVRGFNTGKVKP